MGKFSVRKSRVRTTAISYEWIASILLALFLASQASAHTVDPLITPAQLQTLLGAGNVRVIDIRDDTNPSGRTPYQKGHIPGAVSVPYSRWRGPKDNPGALPSLDELTATMRAAGLAPLEHAVIVSTGGDATDFGSAARVYWMMKVAGLHDVSILNGGHAAWYAANLPIDLDAVRARGSRFTPTIDASLVATREELVTLDPSKVRLIDTRPAAFYEGAARHPAARVPGTLVGARHFDSSRWMRPGTGVFMEPEEARRLAAREGLDEDVETVTFCDTGDWAATHWFALSEILGLPRVRLFPGSMVEWSRNDLPMTNVPGFLRQTLIDAQIWWRQLRF